MNHDNLMLLPKQSRISTDVQTQSFHTHIIKVWEDIGEPMDWADELDLINSSSENDTIVLDICSDGGYLDTAMLFNRALRSTAAHTVAIIGPSAASAASVFALSCKEWVLDETSSLMAHTSSYKIGGKDTDILEHANFSRKQLRNLYESVYTGFLSDDEIEDVIKGTPFYFDAQQLADRLDRLTEYRESLPQGCGDPSCTDCSEPEELQSRTLEEIIKEAVAEALES
ncbi:ATP-dependent Clp protease proteolytic subunit, partial [Sulfurovum sp.]|uniref:ATP-dependent Clp protease proteolytic subunit n=1 Tax=Sulfurovum sp. TaxID=1969726 RepID=UPI0035652790